MMTKTLHDPPQSAVASAFARAIAEGNYAHAFSFLSASLRASTTAAELSTGFQAMIAYADCPPEHRPTTVEVMSVLDEWPNKKTGDVGWAYVAFSNEFYCEAVSVIVAQEHGRYVIRDLEWGRP